MNDSDQTVYESARSPEAHEIGAQSQLSARSSRTMWLYTPDSGLNDATKFYVETINLGLSRLGVGLEHTTSIERIPAGADILTLDCKRAVISMVHRSQSPVWIWLQGISPEEELHKGDRLRWALWTLFERIAIPRARGLFMVSEAMRAHYYSKYHFRELPIFIMPCVNQALVPNAFRRPGKYENPTFVYAGSLRRWQCFDATLHTFGAIRRRFPNARLTVLTNQQSEARSRVEALSLEGIDIDYVPAYQLSSVLEQFKYGFVLREEHVVNAVATPTKVSSYMAAGVIPIMTRAVKDYTHHLSTVSPLIMVNNIDPDEITWRVAAIEKNAINPEAVLTSYMDIFARYFDRNIYVDPIAAFFRSTQSADTV